MLTMVICYTQPFTKPIKVEVFGKWVFGKWAKLYSLHVSTYLIAKIKSFYSGLCVGRPDLTDCGALGKIILGGPQIKVKTKKKKRSQPLPAAIPPHQSMSSTIFLP